MVYLYSQDPKFCQVFYNFKRSVLNSSTGGKKFMSPLLEKKDVYDGKGQKIVEGA